MPEAPLRNLTQEEIDTYHRDGVVCISGMFPDHWIQRMAKAVDHVVKNPTVMGRAVSVEDKNFSGDLFLWKVNDEFCDFVYESPAAYIAQQILGSKVVRHFYDQTFIKPPGCHVPTPWHHDVTFWPVEVTSMQMCSLWITFDAVDRNSSGLEFIKGSHKWPQRFKAVTPNFDPYMLDSDFDDVPDIDANRESYDLFCPDMKPGDFLLFNPLIVHGSSSNYSTTQARRALSSRWCDDSIVFEHRHATMPLMFDHGLENGGKLGGTLFPQILPETIESESARRRNGPELPDREIVRQRVEVMTAGMRSAN
ncbi:MAG: phytanoyl-CoA dioxygenase family protein [Pseudomonadales bacterium]